MGEQKIHQPPMPIEEQVEKLNDISYFRLIKAYSLNLKPRNGNYYTGVTFEHIVELYLLNSNFRQLIFPEIEKVEINVRCRISNFFAANYGVLGYYDSDKYRNSKAPFVKNFRENYEGGQLPIYALVGVFSFGTLSKFYKNMKNGDKKIVAKLFCVGYTYLESWLESIAYVRNICAHYGRLYNAKLAKTPILYKEYSKAGIRNMRVSK